MDPHRSMFSGVSPWLVTSRLPRGLARPPTLRKAHPARPQACFVVTVGFSMQNDAETPGRGLA
eukprot:12580760-Alexandrium_andersonii.AAC.1